MRGLIPGVANHEARRVYDERVAAMGDALSQVDEARLGEGLLHARQLGLWRARNVMGFEALAQGVLGLDPERANELCAAAATRLGSPPEQLPDIAVALWLRSEAALLDHGRGARVSVRMQDGELVLSISAPLAPVHLVAEAVAAVGRSATGLTRAIEAERSDFHGPRDDEPRRQ